MQPKVVMKKLFRKLFLSRVLIFTFLISYIFVFYLVSDGNILNFSRNEKNLIFDYWGQSDLIEPYLIENTDINDRIVAFSQPTGLSYYTLRRVYYLEKGGGLKFFHDISEENEKDEIHKFFLENNIKFFLIAQKNGSNQRYEEFKGISNIFDIIGDEKYTREVITPSEDVFWQVYEII